MQQAGITSRAPVSYVSGQSGRPEEDARRLLYIYSVLPEKQKELLLSVAGAIQRRLP